MDKPDVDSIEGLSPAISIDQKTTTRNPRSTVGTVTEIYDYLRLLYARVGRPHCPTCGREISGQSAEQIVEQVLSLPEGTRFTVDAPVVRTRKGEYKDLFEQLRADGFTRVKVDGEDRLLEEPIDLDKQMRHSISVVVDRLVMRDGLRTRLTDSIETALRLAEGLVEVAIVDGDDRHLLREVRLPRRRRLAARAGAAHLLVQLAARRLPALHRPRLAARDRPRPGRARPEPLDLAGRARPVDGHQLELLRAGDPGDRRPLRDRPRDALGGPPRGAAKPLPARHRRREAVRQPTATRWGASAATCSRSRASSRASSGATATPTRPTRRSGSRSTWRSSRARPATATG